MRTKSQYGQLSNFDILNTMLAYSTCHIYFIRPSKVLAACIIYFSFSTYLTFLKLKKDNDTTRFRTPDQKFELSANFFT